MAGELAAWNNREGISLEGWIGCEGNFRLAVGYISIFWPQFVAFEDYILVEGFTEEQIRGFESQKEATAKTVEWVINHVHLDSIQHLGCPDISSDKLVLLGDRLREIYQAKLNWQFPERPCVVEFYQPEDPDSFAEYQLSFWQKKHDEKTD
jgi:hypothetical protein